MATVPTLNERRFLWSVWCAVPICDAGFLRLGSVRPTAKSKKKPEIEGGETTDAHERGKNFLDETEIAKLLEAAKHADDV
jgi:hypothetical protein